MRAWSPGEGRIRWQRHQTAMAVAGIDGLMLGAPANFVYFTGHESNQFFHRMRPQIFLLPQQGDATAYVYGAEADKLKKVGWVSAAHSYVDLPFPVADLVALIKKMGWEKGTIGVELGPNQRLGLPVNQFLALQAALPEARWVDAGPVLQECQMVKTEAEIAVMREACAIAERAWELVVSRLQPNCDTLTVHKSLAFALIEAGADPYHPGHAGLTQLTVGTKDGVFRPGDVLKLDFHARSQGYWSNITRMASIGEPSAEVVRNHATMHKLLMDCVGQMRPGSTCSDVLHFNNELMKAMGQPPLIGTKRMGHGLGLEATTPPSLNSEDQTVLTPGMLIALEPRFANAWGLWHLEESVLVTETGPELLSTSAGTLAIIR